MGCFCALCMTFLSSEFFESLPRCLQSSFVHVRDAALFHEDESLGAAFKGAMLDEAHEKAERDGSPDFVQREEKCSGGSSDVRTAKHFDDVFACTVSIQVSEDKRRCIPHTARRGRAEKRESFFDDG